MRTVWTSRSGPTAWPKSAAVSHSAASGERPRSRSARPNSLTAQGVCRAIADADIVPDERHADPAYGVPAAATLDAIRLAARLEGMLTDPVYEGKSMQGMMDLIRRGEIPAGSRVLYAHLGGVPAINGYSYLFRNG
jgi:1-aminocyclopropane-1-carboxylate deaminase